MRPAAVVAALSLVLGLLAAGAAAEERRELRIGIEGAYPPFSEVTPSGKFEGFDIDIARALCERMEIRCRLVQQDWDGMIPALLARKFDAIVASMAITDERKQKVAFTDKYYTSIRKFVRRKGSDIEITPEAMQGKRVGVQQNTTNDRFVTDNYGGMVDIRRYRSYDEMYLDLAAGRLDLILGTQVAIELGFLDTEQGQDFEFVGPPFADPRWFGEGTGIAFRKDDPELGDRLNDALREIRADGTYDRIAERYFDFDIYGADGG